MSAVLKSQPQTTWQDIIETEMSKSYMHALQNFLFEERRVGKEIYPAVENYFRALDLTPLDDVKIVILGQDPYHGAGQAHGLSFSVQNDVKTPPSLRNIYKELHADIEMDIPTHGNLEGWARQGVLLLNTTLTVEAGNAASHAGQGWEEFTNEIIAQVNDLGRPIVFMLWGAHAKTKLEMINRQRHYVLTAPHPSPLSAHRGFLGCKHFSKANKFLKTNGQTEINWSELL
jgi:uracil-DNA glycosylase